MSKRIEPSSRRTTCPCGKICGESEEWKYCKTCDVFIDTNGACIRCKCGQPEPPCSNLLSSMALVQCDKCNHWCHKLCYDIPHPDIPLLFCCESCKDTEIKEFTVKCILDVIPPSKRRKEVTYDVLWEDGDRTKEPRSSLVDIDPVTGVEVVCNALLAFEKQNRSHDTLEVLEPDESKLNAVSFDRIVWSGPSEVLDDIEKRGYIRLTKTATKRNQDFWEYVLVDAGELSTHPHHIQSYSRLNDHTACFQWHGGLSDIESGAYFVEVGVKVRQDVIGTFARSRQFALAGRQVADGVFCTCGATKHIFSQRTKFYVQCSRCSTWQHQLCVLEVSSHLIHILTHTISHPAHII